MDCDSYESIDFDDDNLIKKKHLLFQFRSNYQTQKYNEEEGRHRE